jgi:multicomponent Na+:H+ antiporter subunit B
MSKIVRTTTDLLFLFVSIFGAYIVLHGHLTPGGGFQGGAVIATGFIMLFVAYRVEDITNLFSKILLQNSEVLGLFLFVTTALIGIGLSATFLVNYLVGKGGLFGQAVSYGINEGVLNTAGIIPILNIAIGLEVLGGLTIILIYMTSGISMSEETQ